jgi:hypothetical protein
VYIYIYIYIYVYIYIYIYREWTRKETWFGARHPEQQGRPRDCQEPRADKILLQAETANAAPGAAGLGWEIQWPQPATKKNEMFSHK